MAFQNVDSVRPPQQFMQDNDNWTDSHSGGDSAHASIRILSPGSEIGERYEVHDVLGVGGYGVVYAAFDRHLRRKVALKVLRHDRLNEGAIQRFRREVAIARDVHSPHLVRVYDIAQAEESTYLTMELVDGESLAAVVARGALSIEQVIEIVRQILEALQALHSVGIVHRDVKPSNVMLARDGQVKLTDFGLARRIDSETRATETATVVGTLEYLSPEQAMGLDIDARSDLYSLGILLFECLTGDVPLRGGSSLGTAIAHISKSAPNVRTIRADTPRWLAAVAGRLLRKDPAQRYQSAAQVLHDLRRRKPPAKTVRRDRILVALLIVAMLSALFVAYREIAARRFASLERSSHHGGHALNSRGEILWSDPLLVPGVRALPVIVEKGEPPRIAALRHEQNESDPERTHRLEILDAETGRRLDQIQLPPLQRAYFQEFSNWFSAQKMLATDIDHDGAQELVVSFAHHPFYPSYAFFVDPQRRTVREILIASGHHHPVGTIDVDRDGRDEVIFWGIANRLGWYESVSAVKVFPGSFAGYVASTPDEEYTESSFRALLWYALVGDGGRGAGTTVRVDPARDRIVVAFHGQPPLELGLDGLPFGSSPSPQVAAERASARVRSYDALRKATRLSRGNFPAEAVKEAEIAVSEADLTEDRPLRAWTRRVRLRIRIEAGASSDAIAPMLQELRAHFDSPGDAWFEAGRAFHLRGRIDDAVRWYREGLGIRASQDRGRMIWEFVEGLVFALAEGGRWDEAREAIDTYTRAHRQTYRFYRLWVDWRASGAFAEPVKAENTDVDLHRYMSLESDAQFATDLGVLAARLEREKAALSDPYPSLIVSLIAETHARRGALQPALVAARQAFEQIRVHLDDDTVARAHFTLVAERYARIARQAGKPDEAATAERALREFRRDR